MATNYNVCFVCTGNACRSPFAECVLRRLLADAGMENIGVFSVGTHSWGANPRDAVMVAIAKEMGYELTGTTTVMTNERLKAADVIIAFDQYHRDAITKELDYARWGRIVLFDRAAFDADGYVEDPHYQSDYVYRRVAEHIEDGCKRLVAKWRNCPPAAEG